jgi:hypothetical protein
MINVKNGLSILELAHHAKTQSKNQSLESALPLKKSVLKNNSSMHFFNALMLILSVNHSRSSVENVSSAFGDLITMLPSQSASRLFALSDLCPMISENA